MNQNLAGFKTYHSVIIKTKWILEESISSIKISSENYKYCLSLSSLFLKFDFLNCFPTNSVMILTKCTILCSLLIYFSLWFELTWREKRILASTEWLTVQPDHLLSIIKSSLKSLQCIALYKPSDINSDCQMRLQALFLKLLPRH